MEVHKLESNTDRRSSYLSLPILVGTGINLILFFTIGHVGPFFIVLIVNIIFAVASFNLKIIIGAITGTVGSIWCGDYIKFVSRYGQDSPAYVVILIILFLVPHVIHIFDALNNNQIVSAQEKQEEVRRQEQERRDMEQWKMSYGAQIDFAFRNEKQYALLYSMLTEHGEQGEKASFVKDRFLSYSETIEKWTMDELYERNFTNAATGFKILYRLSPAFGQYKDAYLLIENPAALVSVMQKHGLPISSRYISDFTYRIVADAKSGTEVTKSLF